MLTVLLSTFNGARTLPTVLEAYRNLEAPEGGWKIVVVDNGSTDDTSIVLDRFKRWLPLTSLYVGERGKNHALNVGLRAREGNLVVLTDDDAVPAVDWLRSMRRAADLQREFDMFGGAIILRWERAPESWILEWVPEGVAYSVTAKDAVEGAVPATRIWGPNMAVRASLFDSGHQFDTRMGPKAGTSQPMGGETEFTVRMEQLGHRAWFTRQAVVEHMVRGFQMERAWVLSRAIRYGRSVYRHDRQRGHPLPRTLFGVARWRVRRILTGALSLARAKLAGDAKQAFHEAWALRVDYGYVREARADCRNPARDSSVLASATDTRTV